MKKIALLIVFSVLSYTFLHAQVTSQTTDFPNTTVHAIDGIGWSSAIGTNMVSGNIYWTYIDASLNAVVAKKTPAGIITTKIIMTNVLNDDNHAEMSLGVDNDGYIHVIGGQHNSSPNYYVSDNPDDITSFTFRGNDINMGGIEGIQITYQSFTRSNKGTLFVNYRSNMIPDFTTGCRAIALGRYDTRTKKWTMIGGKNYSIKATDCSVQTGNTTGLTAFIWNNSGAGNMTPLGTACYALAHYQGYQLKVLFDQNNGMHLTYNMADSINFSGDVSRFMTHLFYVYSPDEGNTWYKANGQQITTFPITKASGDLVYKRYPTGYVYPAASTEQVFGNASDLLLDIDGNPIVIQGVAATNQNLFFKWNGTSWVDVTSTYTFDNIRLYTNLIRKETYNFGSGQSFKMSRDYMQTWINSVQLNNTCDWYTIIDKYYLQKTGNVRYYARNTTNNTAAVATMQTALADAVAPAAPTSLSASDKTQSTFTLSWTPSPELDVCAYQIYQDNSLIATTGNAYYDFTGLTPLQNYSITVKAKDVSGNLSPFSNTLSVTMLSNDTQKPTTPNGLTASSIATNSFTLNWSGISTDNVGVTGYEAFNDGISIGSSVGIGNSMNITGLTEGTIYSVTLKAKDQPGNYSDASASITVKTLSNGLIVYEPFNYTIGTISNNPDGNLNLGNGLPATNATGVPAGIGTGLFGKYGAENVIVGGLTYTGLLTAGGASNINIVGWATGANFYKLMTNDPYLTNRLGGTNVGNFGVDGQSLYISFLAQTSSTSSRSFWLYIGGSRNVMVSNTATTWSLEDNAAGAVPSTATLELNTPTLLVVKIDFKAGANDVVSLYKNPTIGQMLGTPNATLTVGLDYTINGITPRSTVAGAMTIDELRMGTALSAVLPSSLLTGQTSTVLNGVYSYLTDGKIITNLTGLQGTTVVTVFDARAKVIKSTQTVHPQVCITVPNAGIYLVRVVNGGKVFTQKIIVQ